VNRESLGTAALKYSANNTNDVPHKAVFRNIVLRPSLHVYLSTFFLYDERLDITNSQNTAVSFRILSSCLYTGDSKPKCCALILSIFCNHVQLFSARK